ncbi:MAG: 3-methyl-2-oxobutanoate hydroxymethyltransferase [Acidimicrobiales bacterium]|nr:3-methyl-2-oxobutanoate hydroxymethyltransferase [Acidimicrobiia bacterium]NNC80079.1 3-methyl-2-oxobutanoate hydroxymethyltransferase [Acidimicrobiales bacterium]RZV48211.1 MAG: 3-methyl-2-oxobutanoate hydroxymethyltransferase [Acidimicrobiales bacterium]
MVSTRPTVADLLTEKGTRQRTNVYVDTLAEARAAADAGIDIITVQDSRMSAEYREAAPSAFMVAGLDYGVVVTTDDYLRAAFDMMQLGADAVWSAASLETIARMRAEGVPVVGHVGLIPARRTWTGGFRAVGKTATSAAEVLAQTKALEEAGAFAAEIEVVPAAVATEVSSRTSLYMISMGSGGGCDAQYLFSTDILGTNRGHVPRHAKQYRDLAAEEDRLQSERVAAFAEYAADVASGAFPDESRLVPIDDGELAAFRTTLDSMDS